MEKQFIEKMQQRVAGAIQKSGTNARTYLTNITDSEGTKFYSVGVEFGVYKALDNLQQLGWLNDEREDTYNLVDLAQTYYTLDFTFDKLSSMEDEDIIKEIKTLKAAYKNSLFYYIPQPDDKETDEDYYEFEYKIKCDKNNNFNLYIDQVVLIFDKVGQQIASAIYVPNDELTEVEFAEQVVARVNNKWTFVD